MVYGRTSSGEDSGSDDHLPVLGIGPRFGLVMFSATLAALVLDALGYMPVCSPFPYAVTAAAALVLVVLGIAMWYASVIRSRISSRIEENALVTDGVYAWVRNPIYTALMFVNWGLLIWSGNLWLLVFAPLYWILMTVMVSSTEEVWLEDLYGDDYREYRGRVNRCIPWFPRK